MLFYSLWPLIFSFAIAFVSIPVIIRVADLKHLMDEPDEDRKFHSTKTPTLGGVAIFAGTSIIFSFFSDLIGHTEIRFMTPAIILLFLAGIKDDILVLSASKKLAVQCVCAFLITVFGQLHLTSLWGMFGLNEISPILGMIITFLIVVSLINAFNLIDGINGLAASLGILASLFFGVWFLLTEAETLSCLAFSLAGSLMGFLYYNWGKAKIFMGDTGSMLIGFIISILAIKFVENNRLQGMEQSVYYIKAAPAVAIAVVFMPLLDMARIILLRTLQKRSPFSADRNHIHHLLVDRRMSHAQAVLVILGFSILIIGISIILRNLRSIEVVSILLLFGLLISASLKTLKPR